VGRFGGARAKRRKHGSRRAARQRRYRSFSWCSGPMGQRGEGRWPSRGRDARLDDAKLCTSTCRACGASTREIALPKLPRMAPA